MEYNKIKVSVLKIETVNGKKVGRSYSFYADMKKYGKCFSLDAVKREVRKDVVSGKVFKQAELDELKYDITELQKEWKRIRPFVEAEEAKASEVLNDISSRITPERITRLGSREVFVFGSNANGQHRGGAARYALEHFGAVMGQGHGPQGKSYAIDSMSGMEMLAKDIKTFSEYARRHPDKVFLVTPIGCGIAGMNASEVAPCFECCRELENVTLPKEFWNVLGK